MSNGQEIVHCKPSENGWSTETLMKYEAFSFDRVAQTTADTIMNNIQRTMVLKPEKTAQLWSDIASALFMVAQRHSVKLNQVGTLSIEEKTTLAKYDKGLQNFKNKRV